MDLVPHCILSTTDNSHKSSKINSDVAGYKLSKQKIFVYVGII